MDLVRKLSREAQIVVGGTALYLVFSFFDWQQVSGFGITVGHSEWVGIGVVAGLAAIAVLLWEAFRIVQPEVRFGTVTAGAISVLLALVLLVFTLLTFLTHNEFRHWPAWAGLVLAAVVTVAAGARARAEGVQLSELKMPHTPIHH